MTRPGRLRWFALLAGAAMLASAAAGATVRWTEALGRMPLPTTAPPLNRSNAVCLLLDAFRSNDIVKGLVILPGVADDFYLVHRDAPPLNVRAANLWSAIRALTNATAMRATFRPPLLLLHTQDDRLTDRVRRVPGSAGWARFQTSSQVPELHYCDGSWELIQPELQKAFHYPVRPDWGANESRHFERPSLRGWQLTDAEVLQALGLASNCAVEVGAEAVTFKLIPPE